MSSDRDEIQIITFYEFKALNDLPSLKVRLLGAMTDLSILGTIIIADEGFNATISGKPADVGRFVSAAGAILGTKLVFKSSFHSADPFRRRFVKVKPEIVTLRQSVEPTLGEGTRVTPGDWNKIITSDDVYVLDTRNDYEFQAGTFDGAVNPGTAKFSELPEFVARNLDPKRHKRVAMFCTGGIRCEKFAPYLKGLGFEEVFQLDGGILRYLEEVSADESLWRGECFVFDERISVDENLEKGSAEDTSAAFKSK